jgi:hypothetical protein
VRGVVDSDSLPLNVNRETLQVRLGGACAPGVARGCVRACLARWHARVRRMLPHCSSIRTHTHTHTHVRAQPHTHTATHTTYMFDRGLPVTRHTPQAHSSLRTIKKKLVRKVLDAIKRMADTDAKCDAADKAGKEAGEVTGVVVAWVGGGCGGCGGHRGNRCAVMLCLPSTCARTHTHTHTHTHREHTRIQHITRMHTRARGGGAPPPPPPPPPPPSSRLSRSPRAVGSTPRCGRSLGAR